MSRNIPVPFGCEKLAGHLTCGVWPGVPPLPLFEYKYLTKVGSVIVKTYLLELSDNADPLGGEKVP